METKQRDQWEGKTNPEDMHTIKRLVETYSIEALAYWGKDKRKHMTDMNKKLEEELRDLGVTSFRKGTIRVLIRKEDWEETGILPLKGAWVRDGDEVWQLEDDAEEGSYADLDCELWKPEELEWCWDIKHRGLVQVSYEKLGIYDMHGYTINGYPHELHYKDVEPFIGELPSFLN